MLVQCAHFRPAWAAACGVLLRFKNNCMDNMPGVNLDLCLFDMIYLFFIQVHSYVTFQDVKFGEGNFIAVISATVCYKYFPLC